MLLEDNADSYPSATREQVRGWLTWLAVGMRRTNRQRFRLHELYLLDPEPASALRSFRRVAGLVGGLLFGVVGAVAGALIGAPTFARADALMVALILGLAFARVGARFGQIVEPWPSVRTPLGWRARTRKAIAATNLAFGIVVGWNSGWRWIRLSDWSSVWPSHWLGSSRM
jgi:hypothetical protein